MKRKIKEFFATFFQKKAALDFCALADACLHAEDDGFEAYVAGKRFIDNPHPAASALARAWADGMEEARIYHGHPVGTK
jgi:hypothetical protein